jgi:hypothetical protein
MYLPNNSLSLRGFVAGVLILELARSKRSGLKSFSLLQALSNTTKKRHENADMILWINVIEIVDMDKKV